MEENMKRFLYSMGVAIFAFALTAQGEEINTTTKSKAKTQTQTTATTRSGSVRTGGTVRTQPYVSTTARSYRYNPRVTSQTNTAVGVNGNVRTRTFRDRNVGVSSQTNTAVGVNSNARMRTFRDRNISTNERVSNARVRTFRDRNISSNERVGVRNGVRFNRQNNVLVNRQRNVTVNNNWRGTRFSGAQYSAFRNYSRTYHDRGWWRSHYPRIVFYFGAPYYWDAGYWFPAWGYDPYASYSFDGPIYGYNGLAPDQIVVDVQSQLQRDGYYNGPIDGELGPMTRQAIADFQADHGLAITSAIDEPTLASLGVS
jgi:hypothetical protein